MKGMRSPALVYGLAALAVLSVLWSVFGQRLRTRWTRPAGNRAAVSAKSAAAHQTNAASVKPPGRDNTNGQPADRVLLASLERRWVDAPLRDPFLVSLALKDLGGLGKTNASVTNLTLKAIWRQNGSQLAVVNNHVVGVGDRISGFQVERIDADSIWVYGPAEREKVAFKSPELPSDEEEVAATTANVDPAAARAKPGRNQGKPN